TAITSWATVFALVPMLPRALRFPGLAAINRRLEHEITERKRVEQRLQVVVESAPSGFVMVDHEGRIVLVNRQTEKMFSYSRAQLLGQPVEMLVPERLCKQHAQYRTAFFTNPKARSMGMGRDLFGVRSDGTEFPVEIGLNPIETSEGRFVLSA